MTDKEWAKVHSFVLVSETNQGKVVKTMTKREMYEAKTEEFLQPIVDEHGFELVDVEYVKEGSNWYLRAYIDKDGGIAVDDCEVISRILSDWLDKTDFIDVYKRQLDTQYTDKVQVSAMVPQEKLDSIVAEITEGTSGRAELLEGDPVYYGLLDGEIVVF